jgi:coproporphyrinogen III oxidase-like Fe-S oxidoreductase
MESQFVDEFLRNHPPPPQVNVEDIREEWLALRWPYQIASRQLPQPVWARRAFTETGPEAWEVLRERVPEIDPGRAFCLYLHIPYCAERCTFCDCYSFKLGSHRHQHIERYVQLLGQEIELWRRLGTLAVRPVSTVHLGGGTPTFLDLEPLERVIRLCQESFAVESETEWALESTVSELTPEMVAHLHALGFTRLHVGVQSLEDNVRKNIKRRATASAVLFKIAEVVSRGWIVSVDLIYGLPGQTPEGLLRDIQQLIAVGVDGFSLYEFQISSSNFRFAQQHQLDRRDRRVNYLLNQVASRYLISLGYSKTLFNHFAGIRDTNLYFTFPARGEDCLALGTIADGLFGDYHYRHPEYAAYCREMSPQFPALEGGLRRNEIESNLQPLVTALMAGSVPSSLLESLVTQELVDAWQQSLLLERAPEGSTLRLTDSGSWFVGNMISQMVDQGSSSRGA